MTEAHKITNPEHIPPVETERLLVEARAQLVAGNFNAVIENLGAYDTDSFADPHYSVRASQVLGEAHMLRPDKIGAEDAADYLRKALQQTARLDGATGHLYRASVLCSLSTLSTTLGAPNDAEVYLMAAEEHLQNSLDDPTLRPTVEKIRSWIQDHDPNYTLIYLGSWVLHSTLVSPFISLPSPGRGSITGPYNDGGDHRGLYVHPASLD